MKKLTNIYVLILFLLLGSNGIALSKGVYVGK